MGGRGGQTLASAFLQKDSFLRSQEANGGRLTYFIPLDVCFKLILLGQVSDWNSCSSRFCYLI